MTELENQQMGTRAHRSRGCGSKFVRCDGAPDPNVVATSLHHSLHAWTTSSEPPIPYKILLTTSFAPDPLTPLSWTQLSLAMTTFGCPTIGPSFDATNDARSSQPPGGASRPPMGNRDGMVLRGGRIVKDSAVDQRKSKKNKRDAPAKRNEAAAEALRRRNRVLALQQQQQIKEKENAEKKVIKARAKLRFNYVWVGNLRPGYTQKQISQIFSTSCGRVLSVSIRCSGGKGISIGTKIPDSIRAKEDTQYAHVVFAHHKSARRAIETLNGLKLHGVPMIVTRHVNHLPEFRVIFDSIMSPTSPESADTAKVADEKATRSTTPSSRPIPFEPTEILRGPLSTNLHVCDISFPADIC
ncbi:hypothetical protein FA13DRAFT_1814845 [Coprinellus micaceus]|uniref:RRM domain-containing protein n=1 Tax=Coprinellus micaceus TaxID=71717 RepID=A0A4Y7T9D0_COPMI|nr:hypothetical protein FA13DRAFT_1814845 [Coprinellus micaceus]